MCSSDSRPPGDDFASDTRGIDKTVGMKRAIIPQIELELLFKLREYRIIEAEIQRGQRIKHWLEKIIINGTN